MNVGDTDDPIRRRACVACAVHTGRVQLLTRLGIDPDAVSREPLASMWVTQIGESGGHPVDLFLKARARAAMADVAPTLQRLPRPWIGLASCRSDLARQRLELAGARLCVLAAMSVPRAERGEWLSRRLSDSRRIDLVAAQRAWWQAFSVTSVLASAWRAEIDSPVGERADSGAFLRNLAYRLLHADLAQFDRSALEEISRRSRTAIVERVMQESPVPAACVPARAILESLFDMESSEARNV